MVHHCYTSLLIPYLMSKQVLVHFPNKSSENGPPEIFQIVSKQQTDAFVTLLRKTNKLKGSWIKHWAIKISHSCTNRSIELEKMSSRNNFHSRWKSLMAVCLAPGCNSIAVWSANANHAYTEGCHTVGKNTDCNTAYFRPSRLKGKHESAPRCMLIKHVH